MKEQILNCKSMSDVCKLFGYPTNGRGFTKVRNELDILDIPYDIFNKRKQYNKTPKKCKNCDSSLPFDKRFNNFCNSSCSATYNNTGRIRTEESKLNISKKLRKKYNTHIPLKTSIYSIKIQLILKVCNKCNKLFTVDNDKNGRRKTCCSLECSNESNRIQTYTIKSCEICNKNFEVRDTKRELKRKYCNNECSKVGMSKNVSRNMKERVKRGLHKGWQSRNILSYPEKFFIKVLNNNNIIFEHNKPIKKRDLQLDCDANYFLDFYIKDGNIDLEIDGGQHELKERSDSDTTRDGALLKNGYNVYRIKWKNINSDSGKEYIKNEIDMFIKYYKEKNIE